MTQGVSRNGGKCPQRSRVAYYKTIEVVCRDRRWEFFTHLLLVSTLFAVRYSCKVADDGRMVDVGLRERGATRESIESDKGRKQGSAIPASLLDVKAASVGAVAFIKNSVLPSNRISVVNWARWFRTGIQKGRTLHDLLSYIARTTLATNPNCHMACSRPPTFGNRRRNPAQLGKFGTCGVSTTEHCLCLFCRCCRQQTKCAPASDLGIWFRSGGCWPCPWRLK